MQTRLHQLADQLSNFPAILHWRKHKFLTDYSAGRFPGFRGIYHSYQAAADAAPTGLPLGYDHEAAGTMYRDRVDHIWPSDYPMMFWLKTAIEEGARRVFDLGGHVGVSYYAYQHYMSFPQELSWTVSDVPSVNEAGRKLAAELDSRHVLQFTENLHDAATADILFTSGCAQYLEETLAEKLSTLRRLPNWLLVNLLPVDEALDYWTVQGIVTSYCPYHIQQRSKFVKELCDLGYSLLDLWEIPERACEIPFEPRHIQYCGAAFRKLAIDTQH